MIRPVMTETMRGNSQLIYISSSGPPLIIIPALMQEDGPSVTGGYALWEEIVRRQRKSLTEWVGTAPFRMDVPLRLDGFASNEIIEANIKGIEQLGRPEGGKGATEPAPFQIHIPGQVPRSKAWLWVCEGIEWGPYIKREFDGKRLRQDVVIKALEFVNPDTIEIEKRVPDSKNWVYKTKDGDTLKKIAKHQLGETKRWAEIKKLNPKYRDPDKRIKTGTSLKMPPKQKAKR